MLVLGDGDLVHFHRGVERVLRGAGDELHDCRGGRHGKATDASGLRNSAVTDIGIGVFAGEAGEIEAVGNFGRRCEPIFVQTADAQAEIRSVARHGRDHRAGFNAVRRIGHRFTGSHHRVEHAERIVAQEFEHFRFECGIVGYLGDPWRQLGSVHDRAGLIAIVALVAHV